MTLEFDTAAHPGIVRAMTDEHDPDGNDGGELAADSPEDFLANLPPIIRAIVRTNVSINNDDPDSLIEAYAAYKEASDLIYANLIRIRSRLGEMTKGQSEAKTRRIQGRRHVVKLEMPSEKWDQPILKEAWNSYPHLRDQCLRVAEIGVKATEWKKLKGTSGTPDIETFRDIIASAVKPATGEPTVTIEVWNNRKVEK